MHVSKRIQERGARSHVFLVHEMIFPPPYNIHTAEDAALGFYYQTYFAFLTLLQQTGDDAGIGIERLDDVDLKVDGHLLLYQLKHSIKAVPPPITMKSRALWRAYSDEAGHAFRKEAGHLFRSEAGRRSDLMSVTFGGDRSGRVL